MGNRARGTELLTNPSLFVSDAPLGWILEETSNSFPSASPQSAAPASFNPHSGAFHLWLQNFRGLFFGNGNERTNAVLTQTVPGVPGISYSFDGHSLFETNYSGGVTTLAPNSPSGAVPSPTQTYFELAFLNGSGSVIGAPQVLDLRTVQMNDGAWRQHMLSQVAPAGTASVRVRASAIDMIPNTDTGGPQSAFWDNFSLFGSNSPGTQLLANNDLEDYPGPEAAGWTVTGIGGDSYPEFAARTGPTGFWVQSYLASAQPETVTLSQTVPAVAGKKYQMSGWSFWELGYSGGVDTLDPLSPFGAIPSPTETYFVLEFLNGSGQIVGSTTLDLRNEQMNDQTWRRSKLQGTAPAGTASARVVMRAVDVVNNIDPPGGFQNANFDDFSLIVLGGDFNNDNLHNCADVDSLVAVIAAGTNTASFDLTGDGQVNNADLTAWLSEAGAVNLASGNTYLVGDANLDGNVDGSDFGIWNANKFTSTAAWCRGDFNANGNVDGSDFGQWNANKFRTANDGIRLIPEPAGLGPIFIGLLASILRLLRRSRATIVCRMVA